MKRANKPANARRVCVTSSSRESLCELQSPVGSLPSHADIELTLHDISYVCRITPPFLLFTRLFVRWGKLTAVKNTGIFIIFLKRAGEMFLDVEQSLESGHWTRFILFIYHYLFYFIFFRLSFHVIFKFYLSRPK